MKQFRLHIQRQLAHFVQKQRPMIRRLQKPRLRFTAGAGEGVSLMPEELTLKEGFRDCAAVDGDKPPVRPPAVLMDESGDLVLAHAGLAQQQRRGVHLGHPGGQGQHLQHLLVGHDQFVSISHLGLDALQFLEILVIQPPDLVEFLLQRANLIQVPVVADVKFDLTLAVKYRGAGHMSTAAGAVKGLHDGVRLFGLCHDGAAGFGDQMVFHQLLHRHPHQLISPNPGEDFIGPVDPQRHQVPIRNLDGVRGIFDKGIQDAVLFLQIQDPSAQLSCGFARAPCHQLFLFQKWNASFRFSSFCAI